jgi:hypothetical protein
MPETIGRITIPAFTSSEVFPITRLDYGFGVSQQPQIAVHRFESANRKITQRFLMGIAPGSSRYPALR